MLFYMTYSRLCSIHHLRYRGRINLHYILCIQELQRERGRGREGLERERGRGGDREKVGRRDKGEMGREGGRGGRERRGGKGGESQAEEA